MKRKLKTNKQTTTNARIEDFQKSQTESSHIFKLRYRTLLLNKTYLTKNFQFITRGIIVLLMIVLLMIKVLRISKTV